MSVVVTPQTIISAAALLAAIGALFAIYNRGYDFVQKQKKQDEVLAEIQEEQAILTSGILACLKGLQEQGCNGPVSEAVRKIEAHLNEKAHKSN